MEIKLENGRVVYPFSAEIDSASGKIDDEVYYIERYFEEDGANSRRDYPRN